MSRRRKAIVALAAVAVMAGAWWLWPRNVYQYQGKTVEDWFSELTRADLGAQLPDKRASDAFREMGTNAAPFMVSRINQELAPSLLERWARKLRLRPAPKDFGAAEAQRAARLLHICVKDPETILMLRELLKPALLSTNKEQVAISRYALAGAHGK